MKLARTRLVAGLAFGLGVAAPTRAQDPAAAAADHATKGAPRYGQHCARCHGDAGQGTKKGPPVVGKAALPLDPRPTAKVRKTQFHTAKDVADFVVAKMPGDKPGSLKPEEYFAILAFDLKANGVDLKQPVDAQSAAAITLHP
jgi:cytochrome c